MKTHGLPVLAIILLAAALAGAASAGVVPYIRVDGGGNQLRMSDANDVILKNEALLRGIGVPAEFEKIGHGYGPSGSVGLWLLPGFRVGVAGSYFRSIRHNHATVADEFAYAHDLDFRMTEVGIEAAARFTRLGGLTLGVDVAQGRAEMIEHQSVEDADGLSALDDAARKTRVTCGGFIGLDQTNSAGVAGYIRAGFQYRDMGHMTSNATLSDGTGTEWDTGRTIWLDYGGFYVKAGVGFDLVR